jgi:para-nitrobenzyl esterase
MHGALVRFVTDGDPGWEPFGDRCPVMIFDESSEVRENALELERAAWEITR